MSLCTRRPRISQATLVALILAPVPAALAAADHRPRRDAKYDSARLKRRDEDEGQAGGVVPLPRVTIYRRQGTGSASGSGSDTGTDSGTGTTSTTGSGSGTTGSEGSTTGPTSATGGGGGSATSGGGGSNTSTPTDTGGSGSASTTPSDTGSGTPSTTPTPSGSTTPTNDGSSTPEQGSSTTSDRDTPSTTPRGSTTAVPITTFIVSSVVVPTTSHLITTNPGGQVITLTTTRSVTQQTSYRTVQAPNPTDGSSAEGTLNGSGSRSGNGFFSNTGAVAGTFVVVGLAVAALILGLGYLYLRRKRARELDEDIRVAVGGAGAGGAGTSRFRDDDSLDGLGSDGTHDPFSSHAGSGYDSGVPMMAQYRQNAGAYATRSSAGTLGQSPLSAGPHGQGFAYPTSANHSNGYEPSHAHSFSAGSAGALGLGAGAAAGALGYGAYDQWNQQPGAGGMGNVGNRHSAYHSGESGALGNEWQEYVNQYGHVNEEATLDYLAGQGYENGRAGVPDDPLTNPSSTSHSSHPGSASAPANSAGHLLAGINGGNGPTVTTPGTASSGGGGGTNGLASTVAVDQRLDPASMLNLMHHDNPSQGSLKDEEDYSRRILKVSNPDDD